MRTRARQQFYEKHDQIIRDIWEGRYVLPKIYTKGSRTAEYIKDIMENRQLKKEETRTFLRKINTFIYTHLSGVYKEQLDSGSRTIQEISDEIWDIDITERLRGRLWSFIDSIASTYEKPVDELKAFVNDAQNIHTVATRLQQKTATDYLKEYPIPYGQQTLNEIMTAWANDLGIGQEMLPVYKDMKDWASRSSIISNDDYLYRVLLRGAWAKIKGFDPDQKKELVRRLWEECSEAVGLCSDGHLARISNVFVGYDDSFTNSISKKEALQNKMGEISLMEIELDQKIYLAQVYMNTNNIPRDEREVWLSAF
jgi:hypothetical protein